MSNFLKISHGKNIPTWLMLDNHLIRLKSWTFYETQCTILELKPSILWPSKILINTVQSLMISEQVQN